MKRSLTHPDRHWHARHWLTPLVVAGGLLGGCGGGADDPTTMAAEPPADEVAAAPTAEGPITGFGSIYVGGVRFDTTGAKIEIDGQAAPESALELGMLVSVDGSIDPDRSEQGRARTIVQHSHVRGPIRAIAPDRGHLVVASIHVMVNESTIYRGKDPEQLAVGDRVVVSGYRTDEGVLATFIGSRPDNADRDLVRGEIDNLDETRLQFQLGDVLVDYSQAALIDSPDGLADGDSVMCIGQWQEEAGQFSAIRIHEIKRRDVPGDRPVRIRGRISEEIVAQRSWRIRDTIFTVSASTQYRNGSMQDLAVGKEVLVIGHGRLHGRVHAKQVIFFREIDGVVQAAVESIDRERRTVTVLGGLTITVPQDAAMAQSDRNSGDQTDDPATDRRFHFHDLAEGMAVRAVGDWTGEVLVARALHRVEFSGHRAFLGGELERIAPDQRTFSLLGVSVAVTDETDFGDSTAAAFFAVAQAGDRTAVLGSWDGTRLLATRVRHASERDARIDRIPERDAETAGEPGR